MLAPAVQPNSLGPRGRRTRAALLTAATELFGTKGYTATAVGDIAEAAGVSLGAFYQYFRHRSEVLGAVLSESVERLPGRSTPTWSLDDGVDGIRAHVLDHARWYADNPQLARIWDETSVLEDDVAALRQRGTRRVVRMVATELERAGREGLCRPFDRVDAESTAIALIAMTDGACHHHYVLDPPKGAPPDPEVIADHLVTLWVSILELAP